MIKQIKGKINFFSNINFFYIKIGFIFIAIAFKTSPSHSYLSTIDSGVLVPINQYRLILEPQVSPYNLSAHFDAGISDSSQLRISLGAGESSTHLDFSVKYIPYPDIDNQPAIGYKLGVLFANEKNNAGSLGIRFTPLISKTYELEKNHITPYLGLPLGVNVQKNTSKTPTHFVVGAELTPISVPDMQVGAEIGSSLRDSFSYISFFLSFYFEPSESETN